MTGISRLKMRISHPTYREIRMSSSKFIHGETPQREEEKIKRERKKQAKREERGKNKSIAHEIDQRGIDRETYRGYAFQGIN